MFRSGCVRRFSLRAMSPPRIPSSSGFTLLDTSQKVEEENFAWYSPSIYYNVRLGQIFQSRYQVLSKLGYGSSATAWLCRDLKDHRYAALKVCARDYPTIPREKAAYERLGSLSKDSPFVRKCYDTFTIDGEDGVVHQCFVLEPLSVSLAWLSNRLNLMKWDLTAFRLTVLKILDALQFFHTEAKMIHCDLRMDNFLMSVKTDAVFRALEEAEAQHPSPRKIDGTRVIHTTRHASFTNDVADIVLTDFGEARPGDTPKAYHDDIQPFPYRAPEVVLDIPFSYPVDIWNIGVMLWHMFENKSLFDPYLSDGTECDLIHLLEMVALMGPPPPSLLKRSRELEYIHKHYFDENGRWIGQIPIPTKMTLEAKEKLLDGEDKAEFLRFMRRCLQWEPEKRATVTELLEDPWLNSPVK